MQKLKGKNAILTGASRGIGAHMARALAREGVNIALVARSVGALEEVSAKIQDFGVKSIIIPADLSETEQIAKIAVETERKLGPVDLLINNAGVEFTAPYEEYPTEKIISAVKVNLLAAMLLTQSVLPGMLRRCRGHIVNISSLAGKTGLPFQTPYGASKAGLIMFSHSLRAELINKAVGVSVICPGFIVGDGMYARKEVKGLRAPTLLKPTTIEKVSEALIKAIKENISEIIVNPVPMRLGVLLREAFPGMMPYLHQFSGTTEFSREIMKQRGNEQPREFKNSNSRD